MITGIVAGTWFRLADAGTGIALAMLTNLVAGALGGILIPQLLNRFRIDPASIAGCFRDGGHGGGGLWVLPRIATVWFGLG